MPLVNLEEGGVCNVPKKGKFLIEQTILLEFIAPSGPI